MHHSGMFGQLSTLSSPHTDTTASIFFSELGTFFESPSTNRQPIQSYSDDDDGDDDDETTMTMRTVAILATTTLLALTGTEAFLFTAQVHPALESIAQVTPGTAFRSRLDFDYQDVQGKSHELAINGPVFELVNQAKSDASIPLPNANGSFSKLSTGSKEVKILQEAFFVGMQGTSTAAKDEGGSIKRPFLQCRIDILFFFCIPGMQEVPFEKGCKYSATILVSLYHVVKRICLT